MKICFLMFIDDRSTLNTEGTTILVVDAAAAKVSLKQNYNRNFKKQSASQCALVWYAGVAGPGGDRRRKDINSFFEQPGRTPVDLRLVRRPFAVTFAYRKLVANENDESERI